MKLKLGTRVIVDGITTFINELHADITRGVYKVRTYNPTYEFTKNSKEEFWTGVINGNEYLLLQKAPKYGNYQVGDRVFDKNIGIGHVIALKESSAFPINVQFKSELANYTTEGKAYSSNSKPVLKKLRVKLKESK